MVVGVVSGGQPCTMDGVVSGHSYNWRCTPFSLIFLSCPSYNSWCLLKDFQRTEGWTGMMTSRHWEPITRPFLALERHVTPEAPITRDLTPSRLPAHSRHFQAANQRE
ncbi:hypothetical protein Pcinc_022955 [Petrolisthes cinctipes]|uniref:Uncharacterized protein n=1 Tax=Petrolisthes cinctipes TaxID=88211 RepID=A0AAE1FDR6_PETCI|nr:hypothetical protein Pcinc_022955 [Petrolisthes cinctipes]